MSETRWIPVSERLPPALFPIRVRGSWSGQWRTAVTRQDAYLEENGHWRITGRAYGWPFRATHWMPLPPEETP